MVMVVKPKQSANASLPIDFRELDRLISFRFLQPRNAPELSVVTELGMVMEVKAGQNQKAYSPMEVTELGIVTEDKAEQ